MENMMANFKGIGDFVGTYRGSYDGRNAQVIIQEGAEGEVSFNSLFTVTFTDLDRNEIYKGIVSTPEGVVTHSMSNFQLNRVGGNGSLFWSKLLLHTWDISYLSGVSVWNNTEFGMSFKRV
jgi:hypothetical protein